MENSKKVLVYVGGILLLVFVLFGVAALFFRLGVNRTKEVIISNSSKPLEQSKNLVSDFEAVPSTITGTVTEIKDDSIEIKQFANFDVNYQLLKSQVKTIFMLEKNPNFDQAKAEQKRKEWEEKLKSENKNYEEIFMKESSGQALSEEENRKLGEIKKVADEFWGPQDESSPFLEVIQKNIGWDQIKVGNQVSFSKNKEENILTVYSSEMNIAPPTKQ